MCVVHLDATIARSDFWNTTTTQRATWSPTSDKISHISGVLHKLSTAAVSREKPDITDKELDELLFLLRVAGISAAGVSHLRGAFRALSEWPMENRSLNWYWMNILKGRANEVNSTGLNEVNSTESTPLNEPDQEVDDESDQELDEEPDQEEDDESDQEEDEEPAQEWLSIIAMIISSGMSACGFPFTIIYTVLQLFLPLP